MRRTTTALILLYLLTPVFPLNGVDRQNSLHAQIRSSNGDDAGDEEEDEEVDPDPGDGGPAIAGNAAGVSINALELVSRLRTPGAPQLAHLRSRSAPATSRSGARRVAPQLRYVSLTRLERAVHLRALAVGEDTGDVQVSLNSLTQEMQFLAGLTRVDYLFVHSETGDVVLAGPAEPWMETKHGDVLGADTHQPVIRLEDLIVAMRAFPPAGVAVPEIACSIDPTQQGLSRMQAYVKTVSRQPPAAGAIVSGLKKSLGKQEVTIRGVPDTTRFACVLVKADYRMKLIGIGLARPSVPINTYVSLANPRSGRNGMARWYFTPDYESYSGSHDHTVLQLNAGGVKLISQAEMVAANGSRSKAQKRDMASERFASDFTRKYAALARREPLYAELRNLIDLSIVAASLYVHDAYGLCDWTPSLFLDNYQLELTKHAVPKTVETAANAVWKGRRLLTPVGGGVSIRPTLAMHQNSNADELQALRPPVPVDDLAEGQWWWE